jgi:hypothetical protein
MSMNLLQIVQTFCQRTGIPVPAAVATSADSQVVQLMALLNEVVEDICDRNTWTDVILEAHFTTVLGEDQGLVTTICGDGYRSILNDTIYDRTQRLPIYGPLSASQWQELKALPTTGPLYQYRIRGKRLLFMPSAVAGHQCYFEYTSAYAVQSALLVSQKYFTADTDTFVLDEKLAVAGLRWKWKSEKGFDYTEEFRRYEELINNAAGRDGVKPHLSMNTPCQDVRPGIFVSPGSWPL